MCGGVYTDVNISSCALIMTHTGDCTEKEEGCTQDCYRRQEVTSKSERGESSGGRKGGRRVGGRERKKEGGEIERKEGKRRGRENLPM